VFKIKDRKIYYNYYLEYRQQNNRKTCINRSAGMRRESGHPVTMPTNLKQAVLQTGCGGYWIARFRRRRHTERCSYLTKMAARASHRPHRGDGDGERLGCASVHDCLRCVAGRFDCDWHKVHPALERIHRRRM